ncbi:amino-acid permease BAT1-like protein isoform X1 [Micractinium conductrix]|uniref:Amino-acid permease BAT1-like protein isoform X1 n=1 Tax=Micractinium conductrix TaxID=554055 RepID=A0A2P6VEZ2_9CHLO|nr:amino-acid permease BAT1-like protein isoform X1 [Micractinium conductrix]|eukprot:PSC72663.1 amino-acid permease BAT1-like protein isoform X1 [Micractinium conductrix]
MPRGAVREATISLTKAQEATAAGHAEDEARLRQLGYKQELRRELNLLRNFAVSFGLLSMLTGLGGFYYYAESFNIDTDEGGFTYAGPVAASWGWVLIVAMTLTVALPMAEICSSLPTTGGVYYWAGVLGGKNGPLMAWISGFLNLLGQVGITAGVEWTVVRYLIYLINSLRAPEDRVPEGEFFTRAQFWAVYSGFIVLHGIFNAISVKLLGFLSILSVGFHVIGTLVIVIGLPIIAKTRQSASWVFGHFENYGNQVEVMGEGYTTGITNSGYSFLIGLLMAQWAMVGYDSSAHIAEETKNAAVAGPAGLIMAIIGSFICGWAFLLSLTFSMQSPADGVAGTQQIFLSVFESRWGSGRGSFAFMLILFIASNFCGTFCVTSNSRMLYAFARDHGVIGSHWWKQINNYTGTPINSIIGMCLAAILIGLTMLGSSVAFIAISSIGIIGLECSYILPIFLRLTVARKWFKKGPFHLGRFSIVIGWIGVVWGCFISVVLILPTYYPVTNKNFNYACVMLGGTILLALLTWVLTARKWFKGPVRNVDVGNKTETLAEAAMRGELDETDSALGNEGGSTPSEEEAAAAAKAGEADKQFLAS